MFEPKKETSVHKGLVAGLIGVVIVCILAIAAGVYYFKEYKNLQKESNSAAQDEERRIVDKVNALYNTPDEAPSIVQVQDQSKVKTQDFFKDAKNGDYVLVYQQAKLAILYREGVNKIINTGPITLPSDSASAKTP